MRTYNEALALWRDGDSGYRDTEHGRLISNASWQYPGPWVALFLDDLPIISYRPNDEYWLNFMPDSIDEQHRRRLNDCLPLELASTIQYHGDHFECPEVPGFRRLWAHGRRSRLEPLSSHDTGYCNDAIVRYWRA